MEQLPYWQAIEDGAELRKKSQRKRKKEEKYRKKDKDKKAKKSEAQDGFYC